MTLTAEDMMLDIPLDEEMAKNRRKKGGEKRWHGKREEKRTMEKGIRDNTAET